MDMEWWANAGAEIIRQATSTSKSETILVFTVTPLNISNLTGRREYLPHTI
jgi:hypothetical protein